MWTSPNLSKFSGIRHGFCDKNDSICVKNPLLLHQIHSFEILNPQNIAYDPNNLPLADGWVCNQKGFCLTVKSADCAPVLMTDGNVVAAVHAGWKGAFSGVVEQAILAMVRQGAKVQNISAAIGPCLQQESFFVNDDMKRLFSENLASFFVEKNGKMHFDFSGYIAYRLHQAGVMDVVLSKEDTFENKNYNSYRREPENPFRQYSWIEKV